MQKNITYQTEEIERYFSQNRIVWDDLYDSEKKIIDDLIFNEKSKVLDIGCGCGGLGLILNKRFGIHKYAGVEINELAANTAIKMNPNAKIFRGDFLKLQHEFIKQDFEAVFSLSCFDWNVQFDEMLNAGWSMVAEGGSLVLTLRLVDEEGVDNIESSYQYINYNGHRSGEKASYVVLSARELMKKLTNLKPQEINAYGYYGTPSATAVTPFEKICFTAISIRKKSKNKHEGPMKLKLMLPEPIKNFIAKEDL
jgi:SAM-dependent methyltransferase